MTGPLPPQTVALLDLELYTRSRDVAGVEVPMGVLAWRDEVEPSSGGVLFLAYPLEHEPRRMLVGFAAWIRGDVLRFPG